MERKSRENNLRVRFLTADEKRLQQTVMNSGGEHWKRAAVILLSNVSATVPEIAQQLQMDPKHVRNWIRRFNEEGEDGLDSRKSPGRPWKFDSNQRAQIVSLAKTNPALVNRSWKRWTLDLLREVVFIRGIVTREEGITAEEIRLILKEAGIVSLKNQV